MQLNSDSDLDMLRYKPQRFTGYHILVETQEATAHLFSNQVHIPHHQLKMTMCILTVQLTKPLLWHPQSSAYHPLKSLHNAPNTHHP